MKMLDWILYFLIIFYFIGSVTNKSGTVRSPYNNKIIMNGYYSNEKKRDIANYTAKGYTYYIASNIPVSTQFASDPKTKNNIRVSINKLVLTESIDTNIRTINNVIPDFLRVYSVVNNKTGKEVYLATKKDFNN